MRKALVENGKVVNIILVDPNNIPNWCSNWPDATADAMIGGTYSDGLFTPVVVPVKVPSSISFAQLLIGLVSEGWITEAEGDAWAGGTLPTAVTSVINTLPAEQRFAARTRAKQPSEIVRNDPLVIALGTAQGKTTEQLDQFFVKYSQV